MKFDSRIFKRIFKALSADKRADKRQDQLVVILSSQEAFSQAISSFDDFMSLWTSCSVAKQHLILNRLEHMPGEWARLVRDGYEFASIMEVSPRDSQLRLVDYLLNQEGEWARLVKIYWKFASIMESSPRDSQLRLVDYLLNQEGEWARLVRDGYEFARIMAASPLDSKLKLVRHLFQRDDEGQLSLRWRYTLDDLHPTIKGVSSEESPLRLLLECKDLEGFKNKLDELIQVPKLRSLGRLLGQAKRTADSHLNKEGALTIGEDAVEPCHLGRMPLEVLQNISWFFVKIGQAKRTADSHLNKEGALTIGEDAVEPCHLGRMPLEVLQNISWFFVKSGDKKDINKIIEVHMDKPKI